MQILLSLPDIDEIEASGGVQKTVFRQVCGKPLLVRVIATAGRSGGTEVLLLHAKTLPETRLKAGLNSAVLFSIPVHTLALDRAFDPDNPSDWQAIESRLEAEFLWLPWNYVADKKALSQMIEAGQTSTEGVCFEWSEGSSQPGRQEGDFSQHVNLEIPAIIMKEKLKKIAEDLTLAISGLRKPRFIHGWSRSLLLAIAWPKARLSSAQAKTRQIVTILAVFALFSTMWAALASVPVNGRQYDRGHT